MRQEKKNPTHIIMQLPPRWAVIVGSYAAVYVTVGFVYPLAAGESVLHTAYYCYAGRPAEHVPEACEG